MPPHQKSSVETSVFNKSNNITKEIKDWLLGGDPAICWQIQKDLLDLPEEVYSATRQKVKSEGWGKRLLDFQDSAGTWGGGLYSPKWISTTYTLLLLVQFGLPQNNKQALRGCDLLLSKGLFQDGGINFSKYAKYSEMCITGMCTKIMNYFQMQDDRLHQIVRFILQEQMPDGGWNCEKPKGATHSSFHTTISVLEGLHEYLQNKPKNQLEILAAIKRAHEFLLIHHLYKSHHTGEVVNPAMTRIYFPPRWHYDFLRALDYFQNSKIPLDPRMDDAIQLLEVRQKKNGYWNQSTNWAGKTFFELEPVGQPGRWNTLRALRVLKWWKSQ